MPQVVFTGNLQRHIACPPCAVEGRTVRESLSAAFARYPGAQGYVLDEHGALRPHMVIFVDGQAISDRRALSDRVEADSEVFVMQALSGG